MKQNTVWVLTVPASNHTGLLHCTSKLPIQSNHRHSSYTVQSYPCIFRTQLLVCREARCASPTTKILSAGPSNTHAAAAAAASAQCRLGQPQHTILEARSSFHQALVSLLGCSNTTATDAIVRVDIQTQSLLASHSRHVRDRH